MAFDETCIFCKIVQKQAPASIVYEDEAVMAFLDIKPLNLGHTLVIPKAHYVDIFDVPESLLSKVLMTAKQVSLPSKKLRALTASVSSSRTVKLQDRTSSTCMCMWFLGLKGRNCRVSATSMKLN